MTLNKINLTLRLTLALTLLTYPLNARPNEVETHAHLFMKNGLGWIFRGDFNGPLRATSWKDRFSSQANPETMRQSGLKIVVATLYAHPLLTLSLRDSIRRQVEESRNFVKEYPEWILASDPDSARAALARGKKVLILALEGASGIIETEEDLKEFVDQDGIRIVTLLHLTDDEYGGVAFLRGVFKQLSSPFAFLWQTLLDPHYDAQGNRTNRKGLTEKGLAMARSLAKRKVWIDLAHASDTSQKDLLPVLQEFGQPLLYTHTVLRKYHRAERGISPEQLDLVKKRGGIIGLMPSEEMLEGTPGTSLNALAIHFAETAQVVGEDSIAMGSDFNGGILHIPPTQNTGTSLDQEGFWNIGQTQGLWKALETSGAWHPSNSSKSQSDRFLQEWSKLWAR